MAIPLLIAGAVIAAGAAAAAAASKTGQSNYRAPGFGTDPNYTPDAFRLGGAKGYARQRAHDYRQEAVNAQHREGPRADYSRADWWEQANLGDRKAQGDVAEMMYRRATGLAPSISRMAGDRAMQQAEQAQLSAAASARGPAAIALAQQNAMGATSAAQSNIAAQTQIAEAQERLAAEQAAFGALSGMRGQDMGSMAQRAQMAQFQAEMEARQRALNDQYSLGLYGYENQTLGNDLQAQIAWQQMLANSLAGTNAINSQVSLANAGQDWRYVQMGVGGLQGAMSAASMGGGGGAVGSTKSALTGEAPAAPPPNPMLAQQVQGSGLSGAPAPASPVGANTMALSGAPPGAYGGLSGLQPRVVAQRPMAMGAPAAALAPRPQVVPAQHPAPQAAGLAAPRPPRPQQAMFDPRRGAGLMRAA